MFNEMLLRKEMVLAKDRKVSHFPKIHNHAKNFFLKKVSKLFNEMGDGGGGNAAIIDKKGVQYWLVPRGRPCRTEALAKIPNTKYNFSKKSLWSVHTDLIFM